MPAQLFVDVIINAALYSLLLAGYQFHSILKRTSNFAFGALVALAGYLFWSSLQSGWRVPFAALLALVGVGMTAWVFEYVFLLFDKRENMRQETMLIASIALLGATEAIIQIVFGASTKAITVFSSASISASGVSITVQQLSLTVAAILMSLFLAHWLYQTKGGLVFRAMEENQSSARSMAYSVRNARRTAACIAIGTACIAGIFVAAERSLSPHIGTNMVVTAFVLATLAGNDARRWFVICMLFSGFEVVVSWYFGSTLANAILYAFVFVYLLRGRLTLRRWWNELKEVYV